MDRRRPRRARVRARHDLVDPETRADARRLLSADVDVLEVPLDEYWLRDSGPTFVLGDGRRARRGRLGLQRLGRERRWTSWEREQHVARTVAEAAGAEVVPSLLVNEGGAIHVDGEGTVLLTRTVQLDPRRNPYADEARVEAELARTIGARHAVWLPRGLTRDYERFGTRGHVDIVATFPSPGRGAAARAAGRRPSGRSGHPRSGRTFESAVDAAGRPFEIVPLAAPGRCRRGRAVDWTYVNHVVVNGGVIACGFGEPAADARAAAILADAYPGRRVVARRRAAGLRARRRPALHHPAATGGLNHCRGVQRVPITCTPRPVRPLPTRRYGAPN